MCWRVLPNYISFLIFPCKFLHHVSKKSCDNKLELICQPKQIFDKAKVDVLFKSNAPHRTELVSLLKELKSSGFEKISLELTKNPLKARKAVTSYAFLTDCIVKTTWEFATMIKFPTYNPSNAEKLSAGSYAKDSRIF